MYCAYITTIRNIRKHNNADRLLCCEIFGNNVIVDQSYKQGDRVIYFPTDGQLGKEFAEKNNLVRVKDENGNNTGGYLDPEKRNIKAIKLRGEQSDGLVLPITVLSDYVDINTLNDGDQITVLGGYEICRKYIPKRNRSRSSGNTTGKKKKVKYPYFEEHIDTAQLAYNEQAFHEGDIIYLTQKLHGTSFRVSNCIEETITKRNPIIRFLFHKNVKVERKYNVVSGSRRVILRDFDGGFYGSNQFRKKYNDFFCNKLPQRNDRVWRNCWLDRREYAYNAEVF